MTASRPHARSGAADSDTVWLAAMPKVELHIHLEGAIPLPALWQLVRKYGGEREVPSLEALKRRFVFRDFPHFIDTWVWKNGFLRAYEDFTHIAEAVADHLAAQNIVYAEMFFSPGDFHRHGLVTPRIAEAIRQGLARVRDIEVGLVCDLIRDFGPARAARTLEEASEVSDLGVIGVGIGGSEQEFPPEPFRSVFARARALGFKTSAHAGEAAGADSVWGAVNSLQVDRIGHGTRAVEDSRLLAHLAEARIPLELCPISNVRTGVVGSVAEHPARRYYDLGIPISVNTDDPAMFATSLVQEFRYLMHDLQFTRNDLLNVMRQTVTASWAPQDTRTRLLDRLEAYG